MSDKKTSSKKEDKKEQAKADTAKAAKIEAKDAEVVKPETKASKKENPAEAQAKKALEKQEKLQKESKSKAEDRKKLGKSMQDYREGAVHVYQTKRKISEELKAFIFSDAGIEGDDTKKYKIESKEFDQGLFIHKVVKA